MGELNQIFKNISEIEPPTGLEGRILARIEMEKNRQIQRKLMFSYAGLVGSTVAGFLAILTFGQEFLQSDFWSVVSLVFSDLEIVARNFSDFGLSLLENFPVVSLVAILIPFLMLFWSLGSYLELVNKPPHQFSKS